MIGTIKRIMGTVLLLLAIAVLVYLALNSTYTRGQEGLETLPDILVSRFNELLSPGALSRGHAHLDNGRDCDQCHDGLQGVGVVSCLNCHMDIMFRMTKDAGYHAKLKGYCQDCHTEHRGRNHDITGLDWENFNHFQALFPLQGKHAELACGKCHDRKEEEGAGRFTFFDLPTECGGCHSDPHEGRFSENRKCENCHREQGWTGRHVQFDHARDCGFALTGGHAKLACDQCHAQGEYRHGRTACENCHEDPHQGRFAADKQCESCHVTQSWKGRWVNFDHDRDSRFPLEGAHGKAQCSQCHEKGQWRHNRMQCEDCHEDIHEGRFRTEKGCVQCHQPVGWTGKQLLFDHATDTQFKLTGLHRLVDCEKCHENGDYRNGERVCADCHEDPHFGQLDAPCARCHQTAGFQGRDVKFDHDRDTAFPLAGLHEGRACDQCHQDLGFQTLGTACETCHWEAEAFYSGSLFSDRVPARPDPMHGLVKCVDCHDPADPRAASSWVAPRCIICHNPAYGEYLYASRAVIEKTLNRAAEHAATEEDDWILDRVNRFAPHNFGYAQALLESLEGEK